MIFNQTHLRYRTLGLVTTLGLLAACDGGIDLGSISPGLGNNPSFQEKVAPRPEPDANGIITYPNYQVAVGRRGETVGSLAGRIGLDGAELARHNGLSVDYTLRQGEILALPRRVATSGTLDITAIATGAIDAANKDKTQSPAANTSGIEPIRHKVERGETAYSIARLYDVSVTALSSWNRLGTDLSVREGQYLLIPIVEISAPRADNSLPGTGSSTPTPPSASAPLPKDVVTATLPPSPDLGQFRSDDTRKFLQPVQGKIIKPYSGKSGGNEGIDIAATAGTAVKAAEDGTVALISKSVGANTIVLVRHADNIFTVYSNVTDVKLNKGQNVKRGQRLGAVSSGDPSYLHFEVRRGTQSVDPSPFL